MVSTDAGLMELWARQRDADAFAEIVRRYSGMVYATCRRILGNAADAEEVAQECFVKLVHAPASVGASLGGWLHTVATRQALDRLRSDKRRKGREQRYAESAATAVEPTWNDIQSCVDEAIAGLPAKLRAPLVSHFLAGETYQEIAEATSSPPSTVASRVRRGVELVRASLDRRGVTIASGALAALLSANATEAAPPTLISALGKLALAGTGGASTAVFTTALLTGGMTLMTKKIIIAVAAVAIVAGFLVFTTGSSENDNPSDTAQGDSTGAALAQTGAVDNGDKESSPSPDGETALARAGVPAEATTEDDGDEQPAAREGEQDGSGDEEDGEFAAISGTVVDADGELVEGARVVGATQGRRSATKFRTTTDAEGAFVLAKLPPASYSLAASAGEKGTGAADAVAAGTGGVTITLEPSDGRVLGRVYDERTQEGIEGISVTGIMVDANPSDPMAAAIGSSRAGMTDEDGNYELHLPAPAEFVIAIEDAGTYLKPPPRPMPVATEVGEAITGIDFPLTPGVTITGTVTDGDGQPAEDASLSLVQMTHGGFLNAATDAEGVYAFRGVRGGGRFTLVVNHEAAGAVATKPFNVPEGVEVFTQDIQLAKGYCVDGRTVDTEGRPVSGLDVVIAVMFRDGGTTYSTTYGQGATTDADGAFSITHVVPGQYFASVNEQEYSLVNHAMFTVGDDDYHGLELTVRRKSTGYIRGKITDQNGYPLGDVRLFAHSEDAQRIYSRALSLEDGTFNIEQLGGAASYGLYVNAPGFNELRLSNIPVNTDNYSIVLKKSGEVRGLVVDAASGQPLDKFQVSVAGNPHPDWQEFAGTEGQFRIANISPGPVVLRARAEGYAAGDSEAIAVPAGDMVEGVVIAIVGGVEVRGVVTNDAGVPIADALVTVYDNSLPYGSSFHNPHATLQTDAEGEFQVKGLAPHKPTSFRVKAEGYAEVVLKDVDLSTGEDTVEIAIVLHQEGIAKGIVYDVYGQPAAGVPVVCVRTLDGDCSEVIVRMDISEPDGTFRIADMSPGQYRAYAIKNPPDPMHWRGNLEIAGNETTVLDVNLVAGCAIVGKVIGGGPYTDLSVKTTNVEKPGETSGTSIGAEGNFIVGGLEPGTYEVALERMGDYRELTKETVTLADGEVKSLTLRKP